MIYTKTGDNGITSLISGKRVSKNDVHIHAYGTIDELNSFIGVLVSLIPQQEEAQFLIHIQNNLYSLGTYLASDPTQEDTAERVYISENDVSTLENRIDTLQKALPALRSFIIPGGCTSASVSHVCRTVCRRAERCIFALEEELNLTVNVHIKQYINRLSDYFFVLSRELNNFNACSEIYWHKDCK